MRYLKAVSFLTCSLAWPATAQHKPALGKKHTRKQDSHVTRDVVIVPF